MAIPGIEILKMKAISNLISIEHQVQPAGIELTLRDVEEFIDPGYIDLTNEKRKISKCRKIEFDSEGKVFLSKGAYKVRFNEVVHVPENMIAIGIPRSSLLRSGVMVFSALWDPGYRGRSESLLVVFNPNGVYLERNARLMQLIFVRMESKPHKLYNGIYQNENIK